MEDPMPLPGNRCLTRVLLLVVAIAIAAAPLLAAPPDGLPAPMSAGTLALELGSIRPDFPIYIGSLRPFSGAAGRRIYMALVQPGATDPTHVASAPLAGRGARNDIVFDARAVSDGHSDGFRKMLLDHEYFHARHLAGTTSVPEPRSLPVDLQTRYSEAAAWGFNVAEARAGRYAGLRPDEFRQALDRYRDHYAVLRTLAAGRAGVGWKGISEALRRPALRMNAGPVPEVRARPSDPGRSSATR
jgi:hypothetical protein